MEPINIINNLPYSPIKIIIIGDSNVGKTSIIKRLETNKFDDIPSDKLIGINWNIFYYTLMNWNVKLLVWDLSGLENYTMIRKQFYKNIQVIIICFDLTSWESFNNIDKWIGEIKHLIISDPIIILVGTKLDLVNMDMNIRIPKQKVLEKIINIQSKYLNQLVFYDYFESSSKTNENIEEIFLRIIELCWINKKNNDLLDKRKIEKRTNYNIMNHIIKLFLH